MKRPRIHRDAYVHPTALLFGDVELAARASVWPYAVVRADLAPISVGEESNVQDGCVLHVDPGGELRLGRRVTVGHRAVVHGARVGDETIVGMGALLLEGSSVGAGSIVAAGAVVREGMEVPPESLVAGVPARVVRTDPALRARARANALRYVEYAQRFARGEVPDGSVPKG